MKTFLIILAAIVAIFIVLFISWFLTMKANGKCPVCALKKLSRPRSITMNIEDDEPVNSNVAKTPPMGWSSWNTFRNHINEVLIAETARAMKNSGLADAGYQYINIDDCWQSSMRDSDGKLQADLGTFPSGMPALISKINNMGLKVGLYSSNGTLTCEDLPASLGNEVLDAKTLASWGCEFFKYDFCHKKSISGHCPAIEKIELVSLNGDVKGVSAVLNPEDATFTGRAKVIKIGELPSGKAIGYIGHGAGTASFRVITLPRGKYAVTVVFHKSPCRHEQYVQLIVNGKVHELFFPKTLGFSDSGRAQLVIELKDGENIITLQNPVATLADSSYIQYRRMSQALKNATSDWAKFTNSEEKPIVFSICEWGTAKPWEWGAKAGNMWRTTHDIFPKWLSILYIYRKTIKLYSHTGVGAWNDPDMLEVGNGKLTEDENKAHFTLWCMMAAPLMLGNDIRKFVDGNGNAVEGNPILKIVTNKQLIAIDQDPLGKGAKLVKKITGVDVLARPLMNGDVALCLFNKSSSSRNVHLDINELAEDSYLLMRRSSEYELHELWSDKRAVMNAVSVSIQKHGVKVFRIKSL